MNKKMIWQQCSLIASKDAIEAISSELTELGAVSVTIAGTSTDPLLQPKPGDSPMWEQVEVIALFPEDQDKDVVNKNYKETQWKQIEDTHWQDKWKENFEPINFNDKVWICPSWCEVPDKNAINIILDPQMAFGTGTHPSTALCMKWLTENTIKDKIVIDYGCGSGILSITAAKLGAQKVYAVDIEQDALDVSIENAKKNDINEQSFITALPENMPSIQADIVVANILSGPLIELEPTLEKLVKKGGTLVLAGLLATQIEQLEKCYSAHFHSITHDIQGEWARITAIK